VDALEGIRSDEVHAISAEIRRKITRPAQIVPEIANLVASRRAQSCRPVVSEKSAAEVRITAEARDMRAKAMTAVEIEAAHRWERQARLAAGLPVSPVAAPLTQRELDAMGPDVARTGLSSGFLRRENGRLVEVTDPRETDRIREESRRCLAANKLAASG
jgi:hypothetical protein